MQVENELLAEYEGQLLEKEHSGCAALLQDDKVAAQPDQLIGQAQHRLAVLQ